MAGIGNDLVSEARKRAGLTQRELGERAGTTQSAIARIETGRSTPTFDRVLRLVRLCGFDVHTMLVEQDDADWVRAQQLLKLTPDQRVRRTVRVVRQTDE
jgi:predicted transcriptional regulator